MTEDEVREIVRDEAQQEVRELQRRLDSALADIEQLIAKERYIFQRDLELFAGRNIILPLDTGTQIGTDPNQKLSFWGASPVTQRTDPGSTSISTVSGSGDDTTINNNFSNLDSKIDELRQILLDIGVSA